jgi:hypothetical protein
MWGVGVWWFGVDWSGGERMVRDVGFVDLGMRRLVGVDYLLEI